MNRREFFAAVAAGAVMTASGLWMPGQKLISIPRQLLRTNDADLERIKTAMLRSMLDAAYLASHPPVVAHKVWFDEGLQVRPLSAAEIWVRQ